MLFRTDLEHTIDNLDNVVENTTSAESRIRDTDMAEEMVNYSKNNILAQAGQSMLAQANQSNQGVLSLLTVITDTIRQTTKSLTASAARFFVVVRLAAHVSNGLKSRIRPVVGRI